MLHHSRISKVFLLAMLGAVDICSFDLDVTVERSKDLGRLRMPRNNKIIHYLGIAEVVFTNVNHSTFCIEIFAIKTGFSPYQLTMLRMEFRKIALNGEVRWF